MHNWYLPATDLMLDLAHIEIGDSILDVAAGDCDQTIEAAKRVGPKGHVLAIDLAPEWLEIQGFATSPTLADIVSQMPADNQRKAWEEVEAGLARDGDFFVYLEDIREDSYSQYVTEGNLRASHRAMSTAPYENLGLPYHRSYAEDMVDLSDEPVELVFDLMPPSYIFEAGHRIRVTITGADKDTALTPQLDPPPTIQLYREADHASYIQLPIIPSP